MSLSFSQEFHTHRRRGTNGISIEASGLGDVSFTPSSDHATNVLSYEARVRAEGSSTILATKALGKPSITSSGKIFVNMRAILSAQAPGNYTVSVAATNNDGTTDSGISNLFTVPLIPE